jgi:5-methylcytosine-specific restriction protein A
MKTAIKENRASEEYAKQVFEDLYNNKAVRIACARLLADSILIAHHVSSSCWSLTLFPDKIRLNAGPVEVLVLHSQEVFLIITDSEDGRFDNSKYHDFIMPSEVYYPSVRINQRLCYFPPKMIAEVYPVIAENHYEFIQIAARRRKRTSWESSFSPGVILYLNNLLKTSLPMPAYFSDNDQNEALFQDQVDTEKSYLEGAVSKVLVNSYERNPEARRICIGHYGVNCFVCGFSFEKVYGAMGKDFIHVHHLQPLSEISEKYAVDPIADLRPVCPNCHAMIHQRRPPFSIEEIKRVVKNMPQ